MLRGYRVLVFGCALLDFGHVIEVRTLRFLFLVLDLLASLEHLPHLLDLVHLALLHLLLQTAHFGLSLWGLYLGFPLGFRISWRCLLDFIYFYFLFLHR